MSDIESEIVDVDDDVIHVRVPVNVPYTGNGSINIKMQVRDMVWPLIWNTIYLKELKLNEFSPTSGKPGDIITLTGEYFNPVAQYNSVFFTSNSGYSWYTAELMNASVSTIIVKVPDMPPGGYSIHVENSSGICFSSAPFNCIY